jgi:hypothetical protein
VPPALPPPNIKSLKDVFGKESVAPTAAPPAPLAAPPPPLEPRVRLKGDVYNCVYPCPPATPVPAPTPAPPPLAVIVCEPGAGKTIVVLPPETPAAPPSPTVPVMLPNVVKGTLKAQIKAPEPPPPPPLPDWLAPPPPPPIIQKSNEAFALIALTVKVYALAVRNLWHLYCRPF